MADSAKRISTFSWLMVPIWLTPIFFVPITADVFNTPRTILLIVLSSTVLISALISRPFVSFAGKIKYVLIALIFGLLVSSILSDTSMSRLIFGIFGRSNGIAYYFALLVLVLTATAINIDTEKNWKSKLLFSLHLPMAFNLGYAVIQYLNWDPINWNNPYSRIIGTFGNPNFAASFLAVTCVFYLIISLTTTGLRKIISIFASITAGFLSLATESVQGPVLIVLGFFIICVVAIRQKTKLLASILLLSGFAISLFSLVSALGVGPLGDRLFQDTLRLRIEYWKIGIKSIQEHPLIGLGPDSYIEAFYRHRSMYIVDNFGLSLRNDSAHNTVLNFGVNFGVLNLTLYLILTSLITIVAAKNLFRARLVFDLHFMISIIWILLLLQSLISIEQIGLSSFQWILGGLLLNNSFMSKSTVDGSKLLKSRSSEVAHVKSNAQQSKFMEFRGEITFATLVITSLSLFPFIQEDIALRNLRFANTHNTISRDNLENEDKKFTFFTKQEWPRAIELYNAYILAGLSNKATELLEGIIAADSQSLDTIQQLASMNKFYGESAEAIKYREIIYKLSPLDATNIVELALLYRDRGRSSEAKQLLTIVEKNFATLPISETATAYLRESS